MPGVLLSFGLVVASLLVSPSAAAPDATDLVHHDPGPSAQDAGGSTAGVRVPADGLGLAPSPPPGAPREPTGPPVVPLSGAGLGGAVLAGSLLVRRRGNVIDGRGPIFVYVPGHGGDPRGFDELARRIGIDPRDVIVFDYRWVWPTTDPIEASRRAPTSDAADALSAFLAALDSGGRSIYLVGHSKGGAVITEVVGRWDAHPLLGVDAVVGATILDPPIATGPLGLLQSIGWLHGEMADDGLFEPVSCGFGGCRDIRDGLGARSGVEVVIVRNPDAGFTNFLGDPDDVRVYDLDDGGGSMLSRFPNVIAMWQRMGEAHDSVLASDTVADCIAAEAMAVGSCEWPEPRIISRPWGTGTSGSGPLVR